MVRRLRLVDTVAMAVGGMVGGGIFAVVGETAVAVGNAAVPALLLAGALALITGLSYARLSLRFGAGDGSLEALRRLHGPGFAAALSWLLLLGYAFAVALYAHAFGSHAALLLDRGAGWGTLLGLAVLWLLVAANLAGRRGAARLQDGLVYPKLLLLAVIVGAGLLLVRRPEATPILEGSAGGLALGVGLAFVAFEGFELLAYDYRDVARRERNLPRTMWVAIPLVTVLYAAAALAVVGSLDDAALARHRETALVAVVRPLLGGAGVWLVAGMALLATASAIHATLFACARLAERIARSGALPTAWFRWRRGGVGVPFLLLFGTVASVVQGLGDLHAIVAYASLVFLLAFAAVDFAAARSGCFPGAHAAWPVLAGLGCLAAATALVVDEGGPLLLAAAVLAALLLLRLAVGRQAQRRTERVETP